MSEGKKYAINLWLFKLIGFYQMFNPKSLKMFGHNVHNIIHCILIILTTAMTAFGFIGFFYNVDGSSNIGFKDMQMMFYITCIVVGNLKLIILINNVNKIWKFFEMFHETFLSSKHCKLELYKLKSYKSNFSKVFSLYLFLFSMTVVLWILTPIFLNSHLLNKETQENENIRFINSINMRFPVTVETYNSFYNFFFMLESTMVAYAGYGLVTFDLFVIALLLLISTQYEIVSSAYENLKFVDENGELI